MPTAAKIAAVKATPEYQALEAEHERLQTQQAQMIRAVQDTETRIQTMRREIEGVKANESLLKAQSAIASSHAGVNSRLGSAMESLERVKKRQEMTAGRIEAGAELQSLESGSALDRALLEAGIGGGRHSSDDVFAELLRGEKAPAISGPAAPDRQLGFDPKP